jgi:hypothetical protein
MKSRMRWPPEYLQDGSRSIFGNAFYRNQGGVLVVEDLPLRDNGLACEVRVRYGA